MPRCFARSHHHPGPARVWDRHLVLMIDGWGIDCEIALIWKPLLEPMLTQISIAIWRHWATMILICIVRLVGHLFSVQIVGKTTSQRVICLTNISSVSVLLVHICWLQRTSAQPSVLYVRWPRRTFPAHYVGCDFLHTYTYWLLPLFFCLFFLSFSLTTWASWANVVDMTGNTRS